MHASAHASPSTSQHVAQAGYAVIFLHRRQSVMPFTSDLPSGNSLELLQAVLEPVAPTSGDPTPSSEGTAAPDAAAPEEECSTSGASGGLRVRPELQREVHATLGKVARITAEGRYLAVGFETIFEYLKVRGEVPEMQA